MLIEFLDIPGIKSSRICCYHCEIFHALLSDKVGFIFANWCNLAIRLIETPLCPSSISCYCVRFKYKSHTTNCWINTEQMFP
jgi:hypothetical protein